MDLKEEGEIRDEPDAGKAKPKNTVKKEPGPSKANALKRKRNKTGFAVKCFEANFQRPRLDNFKSNQGNFNNVLPPQVVDKIHALKEVLGQLATTNGVPGPFNNFQNDMRDRNQWNQNGNPQMWNNSPDLPNNYQNCGGQIWDNPSDNRGPFQNAAPSDWDPHMPANFSPPVWDEPPPPENKDVFKSTNQGASSSKEMNQNNANKGKKNENPQKIETKLRATHTIPLDDPYWKPCFDNLPKKEMFQAGIFYIDQFKSLQDGARVKIRTFEDGTVMAVRKGEPVIIHHPPLAAKVSQIRCDQCTRKSHAFYSCQQIICTLCKKRGHVATKCPEPESGDFCLSCRATDHNHNERSRCARIVYIPRRGMPCTQCGARGHTSETCKFMECNLCGELGHIGNLCTNKPTVECQDLPDQEFDDSDEAVLRCMLCVRIGQFIYSAELNDKADYSQINPDSVKIKGFNGFSPMLRLPIKIGEVVHEVIFRVNKSLDIPISLGLEAMALFDIRVFVGDKQAYSYRQE